MQTIEIDFDVFKEITVRRKDEGITPNDVLREVFGLEPKQGPMMGKAQSGKPWVAKGVLFPHGTEFRGFHNGQICLARVNDGFLVFNDKKFSSPSGAASEARGYPEDGWRFWECKFLGKQNWQKINALRVRDNKGKQNG
jgi:hypothetical protein